jgi:lipopolysaccharide/colanic/teichoic acid biosynthesis glycosyltransferase
VSTVSPYYFSQQKRLFDLFLSLCVLILGWPVFLGISFAIFILNGWPIIFIQQRAGQHHQPFPLFKFRTMKVNAEKSKKSLWKQNEAPFPMFKMTEDPRYTRLGKLLSRTGLDELPQFLNIFLGQMSIVGPRPLPLTEARQLDSSWDFRYQVKPGIISEWAVSKTRYGSLREWKKLEKLTLALGSLQYDFRLLHRTIKYLLSSS